MRLKPLADCPAPLSAMASVAHGFVDFALSQEVSQHPELTSDGSLAEMQHTGLHTAACDLKPRTNGCL